MPAIARVQIVQPSPEPLYPKIVLKVIVASKLQQNPAPAQFGARTGVGHTRYSLWLKHGNAPYSHDTTSIILLTI